MLILRLKAKTLKDRERLTLHLTVMIGLQKTVWNTTHLDVNS